MAELKGFSLRGSVHKQDAIIASREEETWIREKLTDCNYRLPLTIIGARQSGKSTLLKKLQRELASEGNNIAYVSLEELRGSSNDLEDILWPTISEQVAKQIPSVGNPADFKMDKHGNKLFHKLREMEKPIILFDEFSYVALNSSWLAYLRGRIETGRLPFRVALADRAHPKQYPSHGFSPFNAADVIYLKDFSEDIFSKFLGECARLNGIEIPSEAVSALYAQNRGQPFLAQVAGSRLVYETIEQKRTSSLEQDTQKILSSMEEDARTTSLEIYSAFTEYLAQGKSGCINVEASTKKILFGILNGRTYNFDESEDIGVLFTLGFVVPEHHKMEWGEWRLSGNTKIRNPLYQKFLESHPKLLY